ncbi:MAG: discoidin domain-containing protein [Acetatifactor sp.]|nr:discoidin domain-containing protein [Acetatifactor sp.]
MNKVRIALLAVALVCTAVLWGLVFVQQSNAGEASYGEVVVVPTAERNTSEVPKEFIKEEYIPVIPDGVNIAGDAYFDANGYNDVYLPGKAKDGETKGASYWEGAPDSYPNILTAVYQDEVTIHALRLLLCPQSVWGRRIQTFRVEISTDGENFTELIPSTDYEFDPDRGNEVVLEFDEVTVKAVRLSFTQNTGAVGAQLAELEIYSKQ